MKFSLYTSLFRWLIRRSLDLLIRGITAIHGQTTVIRFLSLRKLQKLPEIRSTKLLKIYVIFDKWNLKDHFGGEFKSLTNLWCLLKGIIMILKTRKASLQHELVCNKTMTAYDEVILIVALDTVNSLWSTNSNGSSVHLRESYQVNRGVQTTVNALSVLTNAHFVNPIFAHYNIHKMHSNS